MAVHRKVIAAALLACALLSGCDPDVQQLQQQNAQQQQQIEQLSAALAAARAGAIQQDLAETAAANAQLAYEWSGPLRWLPIWPQGIEQYVGHAPDWKGYLLLGAVWAGLVMFLATLMTSAWLSVWLFSRVTRKSGLKWKIKQLEDRAGPLRDLQKSLHATRSEIERIESKKRDALAELNEIEREIKGRRQDLADLTSQRDQLRKEADQLTADLETLRGFS